MKLTAIMPQRAGRSQRGRELDDESGMAMCGSLSIPSPVIPLSSYTPSRIHLVCLHALTLHLAAPHNFHDCVYDGAFHRGEAADTAWRFKTCATSSRFWRKRDSFSASPRPSPPIWKLPRLPT